MRVAVVLAQVPFAKDPLRRYAAALCQALQRAGHEAEVVPIPFQPGPPETIVPQMLACRLLDLTESAGTRTDRVIGLNFPAYLVAHPQKVAWVLRQYGDAYDGWDQRQGRLYGAANGAEVREAVRTADARLIPQARAVFAGSSAIAARLHTCHGIAAAPLHPPPLLVGQYHSAPADDYVLMLDGPGAEARRGLVMEALGRTRHDIRLVCAGGDGRPAGVVPDGSVAWLGPVNDARRIELLSAAVAVLVPSLGADRGEAALEAMASARPVVTFSDAGGPLEFVAHGGTGVVCDPTPGALAEALDQIWGARTRARAMGEEGRARFDVLGLDWEHVARCLLA